MVEPRCPYFGKCGGCASQNIEYSLQIENKAVQVRDSLRAGLIDFSGEIKKFHDKEYEYRNRMDFVFYSGGIGFRQKGKFNSIIDVKECSISNSKINSLLTEVREFSKELDVFNMKTKKGTFRYAVIRACENTDDSSISFILNSDSNKLGEAVEKIKNYEFSCNNVLVGRVCKDTDSSISEDYFVVKGNEYLTEEIFGKKLFYHTQGFFQNNTKVASKMVEYVREILSKYSVDKGCLLDLYGGVGTFGICLADIFGGVVISESYSGSVKLAEKNIIENGLKNVVAKNLDSSQVYKLDLVGDNLFVITDPPRSGMDVKAINGLLKINPEVIVYVSCNPKQLGSELRRFREKYSVKSAAMFDLFPQTNHAEAVIEMVRK